MPSFIITDEEAEKIVISGRSWASGIDKETRRKIKLRRKDFQPQSVHHLVHCLITGRDVFKHFNPKHEAHWTFAVLKQDISVLHPYHSLINACRVFLQSVPMHDRKIKEMSWSRASNYVRSMDYIIEGFQKAYRYRVRHDILVALREYVSELFASLTQRFNG